MSNTLIRKGLVAAAIVALGSAGVVAVPAQAASVLFAPSTGTGNTLVAGETFSLTASLSSDLPASNSTQLKFKVTNTTGVAATVKLNGRSPIAASSVVNETTTVGNSSTHAANNTFAGKMLPVSLDSSVGGTTATALTSTVGASSVFGATAEITDAVTYGAADSASTGNRYAYDTYTGSTASNATNPTTISIASTSATTADYTVTAWLDANNNGIVDSGELSAVQTIHFVKIADSGIATALTQPVQSTNSLKATLTFGSDVNVQQLTASRYTVAFGKVGVSGVDDATASDYFTGTPLAYAGGSATAVAAYDATNAPGKLVSTGTIAGGNAVVGATYTAQAVFGGALVGTQDSKTVIATQANSITALKPTIGANALVAQAPASGNTYAGIYTVRKGSLTQTLTATVKKDTSSTDTTQVAVGAGVKVNYTVSAINLATTNSVADTMTVNGVAATSAAVAAGLTGSVTTDANGAISIPVVVTSGNVNTSVTVTYSLPDAIVSGLAGSTISGSAQLNWAAATLVDPARVVAGASAVTIAKGGNIALQYALKDNFGALYTGTDHQLVVTAPSTGTGAVGHTVYVPFVNGIANVTVADGSTAVGSYSVAVSDQIADANGVWAAGAFAENVTVNVNAGQTASATTLVINTAASKGSASDKLLPLDVDGTYISGNTLTNTALTAPSITANSSTTVSGTVTDASGLGVSGAVVTVAVPGAQISNGTAYGIGSLTVVADNAGGYSVTVSTHTAGKSTVTVTSGAASKTATLYVAAAGLATGKTITITAPATALPGSTVSFSAKLVDQFGNPLNFAAAGTTTNPTFAISASGLGNVVYSTGAALTGTDGVSSGFVTTGSADNGTITITATYNFDGTSATKTVTATASVKVAPAAAAKTALAVGADQAQTGAAVDVIATATDAAGKPAAGVVVTFDNVGQGYLSSTTATTDANGVAKVKLVGNVAGRNTLTATANGATAANAGVSFGAADANITVKGKRATVTYEFAGLAKVVVSVNGTRQPAVYPADDNQGTYSFNLKAGTSKIVVSIAGKTVDSKTVKIKK